ncbi:hypothetical protein [Halomicrococcus gelatinilyticus]|uniref:hypothetical protein n=1 Tax=Halomicrococcus gelatinilyticus TaxID=1702103 RepID=UPI002E123C68
MSDAHGRNGPQTFLAAGLSVSLAFVVAAALASLLFGLLGLPVLATYALPGAGFVVQFARGLRMDDWPRRGAALASGGGFLALFAGLGPARTCGDSAASACSVGLNPIVPVLALGVFLTTVTLAYDLARR